MDNSKIHEALMAVQSELKAPKGQMNKFGCYKYRSCEDILEAVKPILKAHSLVLRLSDKPVIVDSWHYIEATATVESQDGATYTVTAYAREPEFKKGMDDSQITGTASSYARKYALNGLFCIDDTKDADTDENRNEQTARQARKQKQEKPKQPAEKEFNPNEITEKQAKLNAVKSLCKQGKISEQAIINVFRQKKPNLQNIDELAENQLIWILKEENWVYLR